MKEQDMYGRPSDRVSVWLLWLGGDETKERGEQDASLYSSKC